VGRTSQPGNDEQAFKDALAPLGICMHQPVRVAATVLDALEACGAKSSTALAGVIEAEKDRLQPLL
jgi:hypothetical protein